MPSMPQRSVPSFFTLSIVVDREQILSLQPSLTMSMTLQQF